MPPSTTCSHTMSAALRPVCGRASTEFSIFTASAGRSAIASAGTPVSGQAGADGGVSAATMDPRSGNPDRGLSAACHETAPMVTRTTGRAARRPRPDLARRRPFAVLPLLDREPFVVRAPVLRPERDRGAEDLGTSGLLARRGVVSLYRHGPPGSAPRLRAAAG